MKKLGMALLLMVLLVVGAGLLFREPIGERLFARAVETGVARDVIGDLPDGIHVALCGTGSPLPDPSRAGPCSAVIIDGKMFIVDIGGGAVRNLGLMGLAPGATEALLLTHFHSDHIDGMGELMLQRWAAGGRDAPLPVIAPEGVEPIVDGLNAAYAADATYRIAHHGEATILPGGFGAAARPFAIPAGQEQMLVYDRGGIRITAFAVDGQGLQWLRPAGARSAQCRDGWHDGKGIRQGRTQAAGKDHGGYPELSHNAGRGRGGREGWQGKDAGAIAYRAGAAAVLSGGILYEGCRRCL